MKLINYFLFLILSFSIPLFALSLKERSVKIDPETCKNCHTKKNYELTPQKKEVKLQHKNVSTTQHGNIVIACQNCHDRNNFNLLKSFDPEVPSNFNIPTGVCYQCHGTVYREWLSGIHGKRVGSWKEHPIQYQCVDCHNPHSVKFPDAKALAAPAKPRYLIEKPVHH